MPLVVWSGSHQMAYAVRCPVDAGSVLGRAPLERLDASHEIGVDQGLEVGFEARVP